jgi:hypothetical protein
MLTRAAFDCRSVTVPAALVLSAAFALTSSVDVTGQALQQGDVTFSKHIAPIFQRSCENCHRANGVAPMALTTYEQVRPWVRAIQRKTASREMPPWFIEKNIGIQKFKNDISLSDEDIATIGHWVENGAPQGNPADMPPPRHYADSAGWIMGKPDLIVRSPVMTVKAVAPDWHGMIGPTPTGLTEDRYIESVEFKEVRLDGGPMGRVAGRKEGDLNYFSVHHAGIREVHPDTDPGGIMRSAAFDGKGDGNFYITYQLGANETVYPSDTGVLIKAGAQFVYTVHLHSIGKEVQVQLEVALRLRPKNFKPRYQQAKFVVAGDSPATELDIPPNSNNVRFDSFYRMPQAGIITTFEPHMHMSGRRLCVEAIYPDGKREWMNCAGYNHNWVKVYTYDEDVAPIVPKDTVLHIIGWYSNSTSNPLSVEPRNWKGYGSRSIDDMFHIQPRITWLTDEEFKEATAERAAKQRSTANETPSHPGRVGN